MGIYRGAGGSGDAVNDSSSEALITIQARDQALAAQAAAEAARDAAQLAETNAETAETNAETAETNAETAATNAANSASAASTSASNAATSATNAANSATAAQTAETNAETAETNAAASASAASTSASNAATSATNAANSASAAATSATNAANSASAAATSATNAAASATSASNSASTATTQATNAANSATAAATSASNAASSATSASNSASTATTQATNAANSASAAATSATNAANSASAAATSATNAANSATSAASSATSAAASLDSFDDRYLGAKSSAPTLDNDGNALLNGALYFDSTLAAMRVYNTATATWATIQQGVTDTDPVRHSVRPSLLLDFANTKTLDPRITFTRASTGTFYDGRTVAKAEENLLFVSEQFDNANWNKTGATITANSTTAPDGNTTADTLLETATTGQHTAQQTVTVGAQSNYTVTFSVYVKPNGRDWCIVQVSNAGAGYYAVWVNVSTGATGTAISAGVTGTSVSVTASTNGFYRIAITATITTVASAVRGDIFAASADNTSSYAGDITKGLFIWGAQLEQRSSVTAYTPTTTQAITNYIPALQTAASGVARFEHNPVTGESLGLEIEEQRTNLLTWSEDLSNAIWTKAFGSQTSNVLIAPDGTLTADKFIADTSSGEHYLDVAFTSTASTTYTFSCYAKSAELSKIRLQVLSVSSPFESFQVDADLSAGTIGTPVAGNGGTVSGGTISSVGNGWYRITVSGTIGTKTNMRIRFFLANAAGSTSFTGNSWNGVYFWGAQLEAGAFATSYIKTEGSQVTRSADSASMTGTNFSSWYRADEGTLYGEYTGSAGWAFQLGTSSNFNDRIALGTTAGNNFIVTDSSGSTNQATLGSYNGTQTAFAKVSGAYKVNDFACSVNGGTVATDTSGTVPNPVAATIGSRNTSSPNSFLNGTIKKLAYYPKRLSSAELQGLTTV